MNCWKSSPNCRRSVYGMWLSLAIVLLLMNCGRRPVERHYYLLTLPEFSPDSLHLPPVEGTYRMSVMPVKVSPPFEQRRIASRSRPYEIQYFVQHQWAAVPETMLAEFIRSYFAHTKTFAYSVPMEFVANPDVLIDARLEALEVIPRRGRLVAHLAMSLYLLDRFKGQVLVSRTFDRQVLLMHNNLNECARVMSGVLLNELIRFDREIRHYFVKTNAPANRDE